MPKRQKFDWFRPARLTLSTTRARRAATDTGEIWDELRRRFPVQASIVAPAYVPERWVRRDAAGRVWAIVIGA